jgi:chromosome segregation ATPase
MTQLETKIQESINERHSIKNDISELHTKLRVRESELKSLESFIDQLNDLKNKTNK